MNRITRILVELALEEDLRESGDLTSRHFIPEGARSRAEVVAREPLVVSGHGVAAAVCATVDPALSYEARCADGDSLPEGGVVAALEGPARSLLTAERTLLNFLQRLCGVATTTRSYVELVAGTGARLLDTRKTTPGMRELEKLAVVHGGGCNHRFGLHDAVMVKDNHLAAVGGLEGLAVRVADLKAERPALKVEVEADSLEQVAVLLGIPGIDAILLDNMAPALLAEAVAMRDRLGAEIELEASGGVTRDTIRGIAETGVDSISVGALTHSVRAIDLGLDFAAAPSPVATA